MTTEDMNLGAFSVSLAVADLTQSMDFYRMLGFTAIGGDHETWVILANQDTVLGLFQGMFEGNILTFNPGWSGNGQPIEGEFTDVRQLKEAVEAAGIAIVADTTTESSSGPASFSVVDPDGNAILIDQHV